ncbi:unnamed protein product [Adineta steineri]|uniref:Uncharacterized protein n=1 Tax=Adineta steineri TaxID=433720 RepID=A0A818Y132_9BILA|nr:unnamed protein product [Adineta steineri]CAF3748029.1 unnamed protein product [Adineta steineri]
MTCRQKSNWSADPVPIKRQSYSLIKRNAWADDDDNDRILGNKRNPPWHWCFRWCIVGSLLVGIGLAIVLTFWLTSKTTATETLIVETSSSGLSSSLSVSTSIVTSSTIASTERHTITTTTTTTTTTTITTTTTTTTITTTTATASTTPPTCGTFPTSPPGQILHYFPKSGSNFPLTTYTKYTSSFTANSTLATLSFIIMGEGGDGAVHYWLLDDVIVNHTNANANVLTNGGFETGDLSGWTRYCNTTANCDATNGKTTGNYAHTTTSSCYSGTYCVYDSCLDTDYLEQSFSTVPGDYYIISYYLRNGNTDSGPIAMYVTLT